MIAVDDIGWFAAQAFADRDAHLGQAVELAGDELTFPAVAKTLSDVSGQSVQYVEQPMAQVEAYSHETAVMLKWFISDGYEADIAALRGMYPQLADFATWARAHAGLYR